MIKLLRLPHARVLQLKIGRLSVLVMLNRPTDEPRGASKARPRGASGATPASGAKRRFLTTLANAMLLVGSVLLFYVGGVYAQASYMRYAARGDGAVPLPPTPALLRSTTSPFVAPILTTPGENGKITGAAPSPAQAAHQSTVSRVIIPSIGVDSKVIEVGWDIQEQDGQQVAVWQVAEYAVGQHRGSANPGEGGNIVLAGHVGGYGLVFKDLYYVKPGDLITLYSAGQEYRYIVQERLVLTEAGVTPEQQAANAHYIDPTDHEVVTLVTCWPPSGPDIFTQRVVVRAVPFLVRMQPLSSWSAR